MAGHTAVGRATFATSRLCLQVPIDGAYAYRVAPRPIDAQTFVWECGDRVSSIAVDSDSTSRAG